jgi:hypothetical protein
MCLIQKIIHQVNPSHQVNCTAPLVPPIESGLQSAPSTMDLHRIEAPTQPSLSGLTPIAIRGIEQKNEN